MGGYDILKEAAAARPQLAGGADLELRQLVTQSFLAQTLLALSDAGFYEYAGAHPRFTADDTIRALELDPVVFRTLLDQVIGHGLVEPAPGVAGEYQLTPRGKKYFNIYTRGLVNLYIGGYNPLISRLGPLLTRQLKLSDPEVSRSVPHVARGTAYATSIVGLPVLLAGIAERGARRVLDLGCGTGDFLVHAARSSSELTGVGVDMSESALAEGRANAESFGVADRVTFHRATLGTDVLPAELVSRIDVVVAQFLLHEFGRDGRGGIVRIAADLHRDLAGKVLLMLEMLPVDPVELGGNPPKHLSGLDYGFVHPLSLQGSPRTAADWESIFRDAGCRPLAHKELGGLAVLYTVEI